jgi:hypothetical protein
MVQAAQVVAVQPFVAQRPLIGPTPGCLMIIRALFVSSQVQPHSSSVVSSTSRQQRFVMRHPFYDTDSMRFNHFIYQ